MYASAQLWRRVCAETTAELQLLFEKWQLLLAGLVFQVSFPIDLVCFVAPACSVHNHEMLFSASVYRVATFFDLQMAQTPVSF